MDRSTHLQWCKDRANEYIEQGDVQNAFSSFLSDMGKHPETADHKALDVGMALVIGGHLSTPYLMKQWINGFN